MGWYGRTLAVARSAGKSALIEKGLLLGRGRAAENAVAMGKAAEPADDIGVVFGIFQVTRIARFAKQIDAAELIGNLLRMHERHVEKLKQVVVEARIRAAGDRAACDLAG